jgi:Protein of unknown function (DUF4058)
MPVHDWTKVDAGIFHAFHHEWITEIGRALNRGILPPDYYALPEQQAAGFGPDILTLHGPEMPAGPGEKPPGHGPTGLLLAPPRARFTAETSTELYRRKKSTIVVRHVSGDRVVAVLEIVSPGNKASRHALRALVDKACELLECKVHLLIVDLFPPTKRDPQGIHAAVWEAITGESFERPPDKPLTAVAYESGPAVRAFVEPFAVGDSLPDMPLFLDWEAHVLVPLESSYSAAFASVPPRWQRVL